MNKVIKFYLDTGMICPSSNFLVNKMLNKVDWKTSNEIILLGYGNGVFIKKILERSNTSAKIYVFEINKKFLDNYKIVKPNITYINDNAAFISKYLGDKKIDVVISTLPFFFINAKTTNDILNEVKNILKDGGQFLQYQYFLSDYKIIKKIFEKEKIDLGFQLLNLPPAFIYSLHK